MTWEEVCELFALTGWAEIDGELHELEVTGERISFVGDSTWWFARSANNEVSVTADGALELRFEFGPVLVRPIIRVSPGEGYNPAEVQDRMVEDAGWEWDTDENIAAMCHTVSKLVPRAVFEKALRRILDRYDDVRGHMLDDESEDDVMAQDEGDHTDE